MGTRKATTRHHGRLIEWAETATSFAAIVDGQFVTIRKMHPSTYQPSRGGNLAKPDAPRYRVYAGGGFLQPGWGFRRTLKEAKDEGVAQALAAAKHKADARARLQADLKEKHDRENPQ